MWIFSKKFNDRYMFYLCKSKLHEIRQIWCDFQLIEQNNRLSLKFWKLPPRHAHHSCVQVLPVAQIFWPMAKRINFTNASKSKTLIKLENKIFTLCMLISELNYLILIQSVGCMKKICVKSQACETSIIVSFAMVWNEDGIESMFEKFCIKINVKKLK